MATISTELIKLILTEMFRDLIKYFHQTVFFKHIFEDVGMLSALRCYDYWLWW